MRIALRKDLEPVASSFIVKELVEPHFDPNWHFHPHYQLFLVVEGTGTRFIGDSIKPFSEGDLVFLGPNLPHLWRSDHAFFQRDSGLITRGIVVYFPEDFLGDHFFDKPEMSLIQQLLEHARRGLEWTGPSQKMVQETLQQLASQPVNFNRVMTLLSLLDELSHAVDYRFITSLGYTNTVKPSETDRMQQVHNYVLGHFHDDISLDSVADLAGMTPPAFCRYFKARANKTFSEFVSEIRIGHSCKLLMEGKLSVTQVSYESGYRTLSNFNRQFKGITGQTPSEYVRTVRAV
ncbi:AraC family transcriptional regulator [Larkinella humicola]|uniref:Helix-turn-helix transcriptional regulator n=1 Tax=Larkinella humicola TaxID=2607654 RepID=A0A5N1JLQ4_9BACT|nr:AraC family transcriptional regulator [Larkinella humicola]KAA9357425.1 helix-turn-helix transcriptional regulator [Larkinella humicola]